MGNPLPSSEASLVALSKDNELWIRLRLHNPSNQPLSQQLQFVLPSIDEVTLSPLDGAPDSDDEGEGKGEELAGTALRASGSRPCLHPTLGSYNILLPQGCAATFVGLTRQPRS